jgi:methylated-DNA-[protein]-cysteine S-methyltransferase
MSADVCTYTEDEVLAYVAREMDPEAEAVMAEHLGECEACCDQAVEFRQLDLVLPTCCEEETIRWHDFETPFGRMYVAASDNGLVRLSWQQPDDDAFVREQESRFPGRPVMRDPEALAEAERQMGEYFDGARTEFDLEVDLSALSEFERSVLGGASRLPFGTVVPYSELARRIGRPKAARAVGNALGHNPVAIVVPCHRVVRQDGTLGGYTGGLEYKEALLTIEGREDLLRAS